MQPTSTQNGTYTVNPGILTSTGFNQTAPTVKTNQNGQMMPSSTPIYTSPQPGGTTSTTPVVNSNNAQADYIAKMNSYNALSQQIAQQGQAKASQVLLDQQTAAQNALQASETNLKQQGIDIQRTQALAQQQEAQAKADAARAIGSPTDTTTPPTGTTATPPTPTGTPAPAPANPTGAQPAPTPADQQTTALNTEQSQLAQIQSQKDTVASQSISLLNSVMQGTIPLTGPQQALITSLQSQLTQNEAMQTQANNAYTGQVTQAAFRGGGEYTPTQMAGTIQNAVSVGVARIQQLDNSAAKTIADLEISFQKENYDIINKQYDILTKQLDDKAAAIKDTYTQTTALLKDQRDQAQKVTDSVNKIAEEAAKNGADAATMAKIQGSKSEAEAVANSGNWLQSATGTLGDYLAYKRDAEANGLTPHDYQSWKDSEAQKASDLKVQEASRIAAAKTVSDAAFTASDKNQQKLEQQYRQVLAKEFSARTGALGVENGKVNQANHLNSLFQQYYDPKTGNYNIPQSQYAEAVLGLANLISPTGVASDSLRESIMTKTAAGDIKGALQFITGTPQNGNTQAIIKNLIDSVDRQAETASRNREAALQNMRDQAPTDLEPSRIDALNKSTEMVKYEGQSRIDKSTVNNYVTSNGDAIWGKDPTTGKDITTREAIAKLYETPGATDSDIAAYLKAQGKIQ